MRYNDIIGAPLPLDNTRFSVEWAQQHSAYLEYIEHFEGVWLDETMTDNETLVYPLKLNPIRLAAMLHVGFLFGEVTDSAPAMVPMTVEKWGSGHDENVGITQKLTSILNRILYENDARELQQEGGLVAQVMGGTVLGERYDPARKQEGKLPIAIDSPGTEYFFPYYTTGEHYKLLRVIIQYYIDAVEAREKYGMMKDARGNVLFRAEWTANSAKFTLDKQAAKWEGQGPPLLGCIPFTYIPHIRDGGFYGRSLFHNMYGLAEGVNERYADIGDKIADDARQIPWVANCRNPAVRDLGKGVLIGDLGSTQPGQDEPRMYWPGHTGVTTAATKWASDLLTLARTEASTPPIVYGQDEGSQRSALTLALRMIPLIKHINAERTHWSRGLSELSHRILRLCAAKNIAGITHAEVQGLRIWPEWAPILPRDAESDLNRIILRLNNGLITPEQALIAMQDVRNVKVALELIKKHLEWKATLGRQSENPFGGAGSDGEQAQASRPIEPQVNLKEKESDE